MNKKIILGIFLLLSSRIEAQTYSFANDSMVQTVNFIPDVQGDQFYLLSVTGQLVNTTVDTVPSNWIRNVQYLTTGWTTSVCDPAQCYGDVTNSADFNFLPNDTASVLVDFKPHMIPGYGVVKVNYRRQGNNFDFAEGTYIGVVDDGTGIATTEKLKDIKLFPNPTKDKLMVAATTQMMPTSIEVYDILGKKISVSVVRVSESVFAIETSGLKGGFYFLRLQLKSGEIITRQFTKN